jgi:hypothetical protein
VRGAPYFVDDYARQSIQNAGWQASTPKLTVQSGQPVNVGQREAVARLNARWPAGAINLSPKW